MKAVIKLDVPEWQIGEEVQVFFPDSMCKKGKCELQAEPATWHCLDNYGGHVNGYECSHCKMPSVEASDFCSSCGCYMRGEKQ